MKGVLVMKSIEKTQLNSIEESKPKEWTCMKCGKQGEGYAYARVEDAQGFKGFLCKECLDKEYEDWMLRLPGGPQNWTKRFI